MAKRRGKSGSRGASGGRRTGRPLPPAELEVMGCLWKDGGATAKDIRATLGKHRPMVHASVVTLLTRLEAKGMVSRKKGPVGKAFIFKPTQAPEATYRQIVGDMVERVFDGDSVALVRTLFEASPPNGEQAAALQRMFKKGR